MLHRIDRSGLWLFGSALGGLLVFTSASLFLGHSSDTPKRAPAASAKSGPARTVIFDAAGKEMTSLDSGSSVAEIVSRELSQVVDSAQIQAGGLRIYSTLDPLLQERALTAAERRTVGTEGLQVAVIALDNDFGAIRALVGTAGLSVNTEAALRSDAANTSVYANGGVKHTPYLIARVASATGELLYKAEAKEEQALPAESAWKANERQQKELTGVLAGFGWHEPVAGQSNGGETMKEAAFTAYTSSLTCSVHVAPKERETVLAKGHVRTVAMPTWVDFMSALPRDAYPAIAFQAPAESSPSDIPLVRRAVAVTPPQPEVRRAIPVAPATIAFGGTPLAGYPDAADSDAVPVRRALPVQSSSPDLRDETRRSSYQSNDEPVSTGTGFVVYPRSVHRDEIVYRR